MKRALRWGAWGGLTLVLMPVFWAVGSALDWAYCKMNVAANRVRPR